MDPLMIIPLVLGAITMFLLGFFTGMDKEKKYRENRELENLKLEYEKVRREHLDRIEYAKEKTGLDPVVFGKRSERVKETMESTDSEYNPSFGDPDVMEWIDQDFARRKGEN